MSGNIDAKIRAALQQEDSELLEHYGGEQSIQEMVIDSFRGRQRWLVALTFVMLFVFAGLLFYSGYRFLSAETERSMIGWAVGFLFSSVTIGMLKIWYWLELNKNATIREVKRLELQVASLSRKVRGHQG